MAIRYLKIVLVLIISLLCLVYATQNIANLEQAYGAFAYVMSNADHVAYPATFLTAIQSPVLIWTTLTVVVFSEFMAGFLAGKGAWDLWKTRKASADVFNSSKTFALLGCGVGMVIWMGFFGVGGTGLFQMWQTEAGLASANGAFQYFSSCAIVFLIVNMADQ